MQSNSTGAQAHNYGYFGAGTGPITFRYFTCGGGENRLIDCRKDTYTRYCSHSYDAGVKCLMRTSKSTQGGIMARKSLCGILYLQTVLMEN